MGENISGSGDFSERGGQSSERLLPQRPSIISRVGFPKVEILPGSPEDAFLERVDRFAIPVIGDLQEEGALVVVDSSFAWFLYGMSQGRSVHIPGDVDLLAVGNRVGEDGFLRRVAERHKRRVGDGARVKLKTSPRSDPLFDNSTLVLGEEGTDFEIEVCTRKNTQFPDDALVPEVRGYIEIAAHVPTKSDFILSRNFVKKMSVSGIGPDVWKKMNASYYFNVINWLFLRAYWLAMRREKDWEALDAAVDWGIMPDAEHIFLPLSPQGSRGDQLSTSFRESGPLRCRATDKYLEERAGLDDEVVALIDSVLKNPRKAEELILFRRGGGEGDIPPHVAV